MRFKLVSPYKPTGDQPKAIEALVKGIDEKKQHQVLLGVTGSGKTYTVANVIEKRQLPTLVISHNKTLAGQLYQELRDFFPENAVSYFVSYYDYYQPEAYIPSTDTYIEKETDINKEIDKLRLRATTNILTRPDAIVVASVSCIYNIGSPIEYGNYVLELGQGQVIGREEVFKRLTELQYARGDFGFYRGTFRARGDIVDIFPAYEDIAIRIELDGDKIKEISKIDPMTGKVVEVMQTPYIVYPAKHYMTDPRKYKDVFTVIKDDLQDQIDFFKSQDKLIEANRIERKVTYDLEMIAEVGYVNGIENYSRYFDGRKPGDPPFSLIDYYHQAYGNDFLIVVDESHMTIPQIGAMYNGDQARKANLINFGFRLPSALDNRPLRFDEFLRRIPQAIYTSATPAAWELNMAKESANRLPTTDYGKKNSKNKAVDRPLRKHSEASNQSSLDGIVQQLIRPTGIPDPQIEIRPTEGQIDDLLNEIEIRAKKGERILVTTLTKKMAEDLAGFLEEKGVKVHYLHSEIVTLDRTDILDDLRLGKYDVLVGINLLREGLDLPEVSLVAILDADKEGFLRSETSLVQTMGRAARHLEGRVIMYADRVTKSMQKAVDEVERRREIQINYNTTHGITPESIHKPIRDKLVDREMVDDTPLFYGLEKQVVENMEEIDIEDMTPQDRNKMKTKLKNAMNASARDLNFELAVRFRDRIREIEAL